MGNYKNGKWAEEIISLQNSDGTWGNIFHSLCLPNKHYPLTTEQALRRLKILGFTIKDAPIRKAVDCMTACLRGERKLDDYSEKSHNWKLFTKLMLSAWVRIFEPDNETALNFANLQYLTYCLFPLIIFILELMNIFRFLYMRIEF